MEAKTAETSSVKKRKVEVAQLVKSKLVHLDKKPRRSVETISKVAEGRECTDVATVREPKEEDDDAVCASPRSSGSDDHVDDTSCCSSNGSSELVEDGHNLKFVDLVEDDGDDVESDEVESRTYNPLRERRQMTPSSNIQPQPTPAEPRRGSPAEKMPTELELEEFFTAGEKDIQNKFSQKYNYDLTKDEPLEGRYEWTRLKP
ncbi:cyclin-dependent kinase inhibitor 7-like [Rosa rugosa]|uniref:cyclin-dependent kinase inhibitor 7-like n=1 Tax=Rosa rugosa TaxID=74645 RepID=UPI002B4163D7|nr:cyclin-dependent kinase inhibitor 7-like [Rosa rugosa]